MSGSFESVQWNACVHRLDLGLYSHLKEFSGNGIRNHINSSGSEEVQTRDCNMQDSKPNTLPAELFQPP